ISERVEAVKRDERRYWRLQGGNVDARTFLVYLDLVQALCKYPSILSALRSYDRNVVSACLAINVAVFIRPD
ncbi:MAG: hypothetical protein N3F04_07595, partial [Candidatus Nezhaarchaeota archaeon]|nr:hypothetical protein [Candidatus Nezhaarchaeota archaeon]